MEVCQTVMFGCASMSVVPRVDSLACPGAAEIILKPIIRFG
jgi:hypothetical protein